MSNVILVCICNQFDAFCELHLVNFDDDTKQILCNFSINNISNFINKYSHECETNNIVMLGDNYEYLRGIKIQILSDYALNYSNEVINITILGEE